jgi:hypothetical protein
MKSTCPGNQVRNRGGTAAIGHELEAGPGIVLNVDAAKVRPAAGADRRGRCLLGVGFEPRDELFEVVCRQGFSCHDPERGIGDFRHRLKIRQHVVRNRIDGAGSDMACPIAEAQRIAIRRRAGASAHPDAAARAAHVFHHDGLAERLLEILSEHTRQRRRGSACRERHDHRERPRRIGLRACDARHR